MTSEEELFQDWLDQCPNDAAARLLFAEYHTERGDARQWGYHWLAQNSVMPQDYRGTRTWDWNDDLHFDNLDGAIPHVFFACLEGGRLASSESYREYPTRLAAEEAFCHALLINEDDQTFV